MNHNGGNMEFRWVTHSYLTHDDGEISVKDGWEMDNMKSQWTIEETK